MVEFKADSVLPSLASNQKSSNFNTNKSKLLKAYEDAKSAKGDDHELGQNSFRDSTKNKSPIQKYYTVGDCEKPDSSVKQSISGDEEDLVYSSSSLRNKSKSFKNTNIMIGTSDNNGFIYASNSSFVSMKTIDKKNEINVQNFEYRHEDTEATNFSKSIKIDSKI